MKTKIFLVLFFLTIFFTLPSYGGELTFQFINPSFGGNPLNGTFLLQQAQLQNKFKEKTPEQSLLQQLTPMYQAQYLSTVLDQASQGKLSLTPGETFTMGSLLITVVSVGSNKISFRFSDATTGQQTTFEVPIVPPTPQ